MFRKTVFWLHLSCGIVAGLVVLMMSVTGVILTYERQIQVWEDRSYYSAPNANQQSLTADEIILASREIDGFEPTTLLISSDENAPAVLRQGRSRTLFLNPYSGEVYPPHADTLSRFFSNVRGWHRWFNLSNENRSAARVITGASNLMFFFLLVSGAYLWLPRIISMATIRARTLFGPNANNSTARDFNWHHVFGFWAALPLAVIISSATVFNYTWANNLVYRLAGEAPPVRNSSNIIEPSAAVLFKQLPLDDLIVTAKGYSDSWRTLSLPIPDQTAATITLTIDEGDGGQPQKRHAITLDISSGELIAWKPFTSQTAGQQIRRWLRFLHTGEALGIFGQTIAGLASFAATMMVWTGLSLAYRRLRRWLSRQRNPQSTEVHSV